MIKKEELTAKFQELEQERNKILTEQIEIQGKIKLLDEIEAEKNKPTE